MWCIPTIDAEFLYRMEDVLEVYARPHDPDEPVVCLDETSIQLIAETRTPLPARPGEPERYDYEYRRNGTANLFMLVEPRGGWRHVAVTDHRTKHDFARQLQALATEYYPSARTIHLVLDNLNTHTLAALYEVYPATEARDIVRRFVLHPTPVHASWLDMAEIELSLLSRQCLHRRIGDRAMLEHAVSAWETARNAQHATIDWSFTIDKARDKLARHYLSPSAC
jgi:hypothetical protein